jgi:hypothetical protein
LRIASIPRLSSIASSASIHSQSFGIFVLEKLDEYSSCTDVDSLFFYNDSELDNELLLSFIPYIYDTLYCGPFVCFYIIRGFLALELIKFAPPI